MALKIAINGFGRIGRCVARIAARREDVELVAINDMASKDMILYLFKNDSVHGTFEDEAYEIDENHFNIAGKSVRIFSESNPKNVNFAECGAEIVLECTGVFLTQESAQIHIDNGIKKVLFSAPAKDSLTPTFVMGVNEHLYNGEKIVSSRTPFPENASPSGYDSNRWPSVQQAACHAFIISLMRCLASGFCKLASKE